MPVFFANLLRILTIGSVGYAGADLLNYFRARKEGQQVATVPETIQSIFFSWRFLVFLVVIALGIFAFLRNRFYREGSYKNPQP